MSHLSEKLADLRRRLSENAHEEQSLIRTLNAALNHVDDELLSEIRHVTAQHEARRAVILNELQNLASRVCALPISAPEPHAPAIEEGGERIVPMNGRLGQNMSGQNMGGQAMNGQSMSGQNAGPNGNHYANGTHAPGNWRIAAQNIQDDLDFFEDHPHQIRVAQ